MDKKLRILKYIAVFLPIVAILLPFWVLDFSSPIYGWKWLRLTIYGYGVVDGPIDQINIANHYVGLAEINPDNIFELKLLPLLFGVSFILGVLAVFSRIPKDILLKIYILILVFVPIYFQYWLYNYGHNIDYDKAAIHIDPFIPYLMGAYQIANFKLVTYLHLGYWLLIVAWLILYINYRRRLL